MPRLNITARAITALKPPTSGQIDYWDTSLPGFGVRVSYGGCKAWIVMYRVGRRKRRLTLGTCPPMTLAAARDLAKAALVTVQKGGDPALAKKAARDAETFEEVATLYIEEYAKPNKKSWRLDEKALERDVKPQFKNRKAKSITKQDIRDLLKNITNRGSPIQANRTFEILRKLCNWAVAEEYLTDNPCQGISKPAKENQRDKVLTEDEIKAVWAAFEHEDQLVATMFKLRLATAQRGGEIASMRWKDLDLATGWWTVPAERAKNGLSHRVPLSPLTRQLVEKVRPENSRSPWVFPSPIKDGYLDDLVRATRRIRKRANVEFVPHDLRRTAASFMTGMGMPRLTVKKLLNHVERDVTATYDRHSYDREKKTALAAWGARLQEIISGQASAAERGKVVPLR